MAAIVAIVVALVLVFIAFWLWTPSSPRRKGAKPSQSIQSACADDGVVIDVWPMELARYDSGTSASSQDDGRSAIMTCSSDDASPVEDNASASDSGGGWFEFVDDD